MSSKMSSKRNFSSNSISISESFKNDAAFLRDVPDLLTPEVECEVPHYYVSLPALGPLWCSWYTPCRIYNQRGVRQRRGISIPLWERRSNRHRRRNREEQPGRDSTHVQAANRSRFRSHMGVDTVPEQAVHPHRRQQPSHLENGFPRYYGVCRGRSEGKLHSRMFRQK